MARNILVVEDDRNISDLILSLIHISEPTRH